LYVRTFTTQSNFAIIVITFLNSLLLFDPMDF
jgi:hypothetical protein